jgi:putative endonuclease
MKPIGTHNYFVYITSNQNKTVLYIGVTNDLYTRLIQHKENAAPVAHKSFAGRYNAYHLLWFERYNSIEHAIEREKEIKKWRRSKKVELINSFNPDWKFLNDEVE